MTDTPEIEETEIETEESPTLTLLHDIAEKVTIPRRPAMSGRQQMCVKIAGYICLTAVFVLPPLVKGLKKVEIVGPSFDLMPKHVD